MNSAKADLQIRGYLIQFKKRNHLLPPCFLSEGLYYLKAHYILKPVRLYHRTLKQINVRYENKDAIVEAAQNFEIAKKWIKKFFFSLD